MLPQPGRSQSLLPLTQEFDQEQLEEEGFKLVQDAIQLSRFQQYEWAIPRARLATQLVPNRFEGWYILGTLLVQEEEVEEGIQALKKAKRLDSSESGIFAILGAAYFQQGEYELAVPELETALGLGDNSIEVLFDLGNAQLKLARYDDAIATYEQAIIQRDDFWPAINNIGLIQYEQGKIDQAIQQWEASVAIDPAMAEPQLAIAVATYVKGDRDTGLALAKAALELDGRYGDLDFLDENLWGEALLRDTETLFATPTIQAILQGISDSAFQPEME